MKRFLISGVLLMLIFNSYTVFAQDADNDGVVNLSDNDADNDGITDDNECGANSSSMTLNGAGTNVRPTAPPPTQINESSLGGYPVTASFTDPGNRFDPITGAQKPFAEQGKRTVTFNATGNLGPNDVYEGCEIRVKFNGFDDGINVFLNGDTLLKFGQGNFQRGACGSDNGPFGNDKRFGTPTGCWWPGSGNMEMVITDGNIQIFCDVNPNFGGGREDILPYLRDYAGIPAIGRPPYPVVINKNFTLDCTKPFDFSYTSISIGGGGHNMEAADVSVNMFVCPDTDGDRLTDNIDNDSDGDGCYDAIEAGYADPDGDGYIGISPFSVDAVGKVIGHGGYSGTNSDVITIGPDANGNGISDACDTCTTVPLVNIGKDTVLCEGENLLLDATTLYATYLWQDNSTDSTFNVTQGGIYWVEVTVFGCIARDTIVVDLDTIPDIDFGNDTILCDGQSLKLDVTNQNVVYLWQDNTTTPIFNVSHQGSYWAQITARCGSKSDTINVEIDTIPTIELGKDTILCPGETLPLDVTTPNVTYLWQDNSTGPTFTITAEGTHWVQISASCGVSSDTINVNFGSIPITDLGEDTTLCQDQVLLLDATTTQSVDYLWQDNSTSSFISIDQKGLYWVELTSNCGVYSDSIVVDIDDCNCTLYVPNSFTPNFDSSNDKFSPKIDCDDISEYSFSIFNRWGELIFDTISPENGWNGNYKGSLVQSGVYVYRIKYKYKGSFNEKLGKVNLLK